jgi:hypothetical protein
MRYVSSSGVVPHCPILILFVGCYSTYMAHSVCKVASCGHYNSYHCLSPGKHDCCWRFSVLVTVFCDVQIYATVSTLLSTVLYCNVGLFAFTGYTVRH